MARLVIDEGVVAKRFRPVSRGVAHSYVKRASHVTVVLDEIQTQKRAAAKQVTEIDTVTVEDLVASGDSASAQGKSTGELEGDLRTNQKKKMQQQGGDKKKTHRRKSM